MNQAKTRKRPGPKPGSIRKPDRTAITARIERDNLEWLRRQTTGGKGAISLSDVINGIIHYVRSNDVQKANE